MNDIFFNWNRTRRGDIRGGPTLVHYLVLFFATAGILLFIVGIYNNILKNRQGFLLSSLGLMMIIMSFCFPFIELSDNRIGFVYLLYTGIIVTIILGFILVTLRGYKTILKMTLYIGIMLQCVLLYLLLQGIGLYSGLWFLQPLLYRLSINTILLVSLAPSDKL